MQNKHSSWASMRFAGLVCFGLVVLCGGLMAAEAQPQMSLLQAAVLGLVEGLTEYLPVSSTGHLLVVSHFMGLDGSEAAKRAVDAYSIAIQIGAILAVLVLYPGRIGQMLKGVAGRDRQGLNLAVNTVAAFVPAAVIGLLLVKLIKQYLFGVWPIVAAWFFGGIAILLVARRVHHGGAKGLSVDELAWKSALVVGFIQCIAMWPGVSRSLVTILGGVLVGLSVPAAVEFSFLLGLVTLGCATAYELVQEGAGIMTMFGWQAPVLGIAVAFVSAVVAVKWMVAYLNRHGLEIFGYYRIVLAVLVLVMIQSGLM